MLFRPVTLPPTISGSLWLASMPGRFETWSDFEAEAQRRKLGLVVCLTTRDELRELSPTYHRELALGTLPFRWLNVPMPNFGIPEDRAAFRRGIDEIVNAVRSGDAVMMHCAAGMGRTGSTAACVLKALGLPTEDALQRIRDAGSNPQNAQQSGLVDWF